MAWSALAVDAEPRARDDLPVALDVRPTATENAPSATARVPKALAKSPDAFDMVPTDTLACPDAVVRSYLLGFAALFMFAGASLIRFNSECSLIRFMVSPWVSSKYKSSLPMATEA